VVRWKAWTADFKATTKGQSDVNDSAQPARIPDHLHPWWQRTTMRWETMLLMVAVIIFIVNSIASPYFLDPWNLSDATFNFTEKALIAFAMALLIISGEIDLSVASIIALVSTAMGFAAQFGFGVPVLVLIGMTVGLLCGAFNGVLVTALGLPSIVVTIGTMSLFRGISYIVLGDQAFTQYPAALSFFGQGYVWWVISFELALFAVTAVVFGVLLHKTQFGRAVTMIGNNPTGALYSGIYVNRVKFILFLLTGLMSAIAAICLTSRLGSTRPSIAFGWELEIITIVVLGGVNILGGSGTIVGVFIAAFIMGMVTFGFGLLNIPGIVMSIFVGLMLISVIAIPRVWAQLASARKAS
jgi:rhamnose transport system permease protein